MKRDSLQAKAGKANDGDAYKAYAEQRERAAKMEERLRHEYFTLNPEEV